MKLRKYQQLKLVLATVFLVILTSCTFYNSDCSASDPTCNPFLIALLYTNCPGTSRFVTFHGGDGASVQLGSSVETVGADQGFISLNSVVGNFGNPLEAFHPGGATDDDIYVRRFNRFGGIHWSTFIGSTQGEAGAERQSIQAIPGSDDFLIASSAGATYNTPLIAHAGPAGTDDAALLRINANGAIIWNTFLGVNGNFDSGKDVALFDDGSSVFIWDASGILTNIGTAPLQAFNVAAATDFGVASLNPEGNLNWHTFFGGTGSELAITVSITPENQILVAGEITAAVNVAFTNPQNAQSALTDSIVVRYDSSGSYISHTYFGGTGDDNPLGLLALNNGDFILMGSTDIAFGSGALIAHSGGGNIDFFILRSDSNGNTKWLTFIPAFVAASSDVKFSDMKFDSDGNLLLAGSAAASFGSPINVYNGGLQDILLAKLNVENGNLLKHTYLGGSNRDLATDIRPSCDGGYSVSIIGTESFGSPLNPYASGAAFNPGLLKTDSNFQYQ